jgi:hypothetical protein
MASFFRTKVQKDIGTTPTTVLATGGANRFTLIGCNLANTTDEVVIVDVTITDSTAVTGYYIKQLVIEPYTSAKIVTNGEKIILAENTSMSVVSDTEDSIDLIASYAEIV